MQACLGYSQWRYFENALKKAVISCKKSGNDPQNHFAGVRKMVSIGSQTEREVEDWHLSRFAPSQTVRNEATVINNRTYVGHALDRMQDRGFMPSVIENAIETGKVSPTIVPGRVEYYDPVNNLRVIVQDNERIISVIPKRSKP